MRRFFWTLITLGIVFSVILGACGDGQPTTVPEPTEEEAVAPEPTEEPAEPPEPEVLKEEIVVADALPATTLDPHGEGFSQADTEILLSVHDLLVNWKDGLEGSEIVGRLATDWSVSEDGTLWTFTLRDDVVWQKGYGPFTADDVVFTYERLLDPDRSRSFGLVEDLIESVTAVDDYTVEFKLFNPNADFIRGYIMSHRTGTIISRAALEDIGDDDYARNPIGTGPYQLVSRVIGEGTILEINPDYWGEMPSVPRFVFVEIPEESVRADALEAGEIDIASFRDPTTIGRLMEVEDLQVDIAYDRPAIWVLPISELAVPDVRAREAIARAINKQELAETVLQFRSNPNVTAYHGPGLAGFPEDRTEELYPYDPELAKELLAEAGIAPGELTLVYKTRADFLETSQAIEGYLTAIGINVDLVLEEHALFRESIRSRGEKYDLTNFFPSRSTATQMLAYYGQVRATNQYEAGIPDRIAELYALQAQEVDPDARDALIGELLDIVEADIPWVVFGYAGSAATGHPGYIQGPFYNYVSELALALEYITIDQAAYAESMK
jgi:peptide/nickel transport system substrate-binding protein